MDDSEAGKLWCVRNFDFFSCKWMLNLFKGQWHSSALIKKNIRFCVWGSYLSFIVVVSCVLLQICSSPTVPHFLPLFLPFQVRLFCPVHVCSTCVLLSCPAWSVYSVLLRVCWTVIRPMCVCARARARASVRFLGCCFLFWPFPAPNRCQPYAEPLKNN